MREHRGSVTEKLQGYFEQTLEDRRLTRGERRALRAVLEDVDLSAEDRARLLSQAFALARDALSTTDGGRVLAWLEGVTKLLSSPAAGGFSEACFSPRQDCSARLRQLLDESSGSVHICVFTITDDSISRAILRAHDRGVAVRIITDDEKIHAQGADVIELAQAGIPVRMDDSPHHMHHKFAIFDRQLLITGSYNWTLSAASRNQENVVITRDPHLVGEFLGEFERLWTSFARGS